MSIDPNIAGAAVVLTLMGVELGVGRMKGRSLFRLGDSLSDLGCTLGQLVLMSVLGFSTLSMYAWLQSTFAVFSFPETGIGAWLAAWLLMEFAFYWRHRAGHQVHLFWTIHEVHHQSSEYNYAVAQRVGYLQWLHTAVFVLPLAVLGIPLPMFAALFAAIHFYQFLIHTQLVDRLGPLEWVFMTPSHHRVHHGRNPRYLDTNFGFTVVFWDRLFGTFQAEDEEAVFGTLRDLPTWNPIDNNVRPWWILAKRMASAPSLASALTVPFRHPAYDPSEGRLRLPDRSEAPCVRHTPRDPPADRPAAIRPLLIGGFIVAAVLGLSLVAFHQTWAWPVRTAVGTAVFSLTALTGFLGSRP